MNRFISFLSFFLPLALATGEAQSTETNGTKLNLSHFTRANQSMESLEPTDDLDLWMPPLEMSKNYAYYHSGFDYENHPVWIMELGRWNVGKIVADGPEVMATFDKYIDQAIHRWTKSYKSLGTRDDPVDGVTIICDMEGLDLLQLANVPTVSYMLHSVSRFNHWPVTIAHRAFFPNTNVLASSFVNLLRPVLGSDFGKIEVYGTQKARWQPQLTKHIPRDQLPTWYGGTMTWMPVQVFG